MPTSPRTWGARRAGTDVGTPVPDDAELSRFWALSPSLLAIAGYDGALRKIDDAWRTSLGWADEDLLGRPLADLFHPEDRDNVRSATLELTSGSDHVGFEARVAVAGGGWQAFLFSAAPAPDGLAYLVGTEFEQRRAAARLLGAERAVAGVLTEEAGLEETVPRLLRVIGEALEWDVVTWWEVDPRADLLRASHTWHQAGDAGDRLARETADKAFARGVDLPGRVWAAGQ